MRQFPPPWTIEELEAGFKVVNSNGRTLAYIYGHADQRDAAIAKSLTLDCGMVAVRRISCKNGVSLTMTLKHLFVAVPAALFILANWPANAGQTINDRCHRLRERQVGREGS